MVHLKYNWRAYRPYGAKMDIKVFNIYLVDKIKNIPYMVEVDIVDMGERYDCDVRIANRIIGKRGRKWDWVINTEYTDTFSTTLMSIDQILESVEKLIPKKISGRLTPISEKDFREWSQNVPVEKPKRHTEYGIYIKGYRMSRYESPKNGWYSEEWGVMPKPSYATHFSSKSKAESIANKLTFANPDWEITVKSIRIS